MTRYRCPIRAVHADGTVCTHKVKPSGRSEDECPGRAGYEATCSCGHPLGRYSIRAVLEEDRRMHLRRHETQDGRPVVTARPTGRVL